MAEEATTEATAEARRILLSRLRSPTFWLAGLVLTLAAALYFPFFFPDSPQSLGGQSEQFFFQANEAAGAPVLILSLWLFYRRSHRRDVLKGPGSPILATIMLVVTAGVFGWGAHTTAADIQLVSVIGLVAGIVLLFGGARGLHVYWLPILFLGFALPISPVLLAATVYPIQLATAEYAGLILNGIGAASFVQGDQILRAGDSFMVIETCSGIRTIVTLIMLTILLIDLFERRGWHAAILIGLAPIVAFLANGMRVVTLVLNPHSNIHSIHNLQGIVMLLLGLVMLVLLDGFLERHWGREDPRLTTAQGDNGTISRARRGPIRYRTLLVGIVLLLVAMGALDRQLPRWSLPSGELTEKPGDLLARTFGEDPGAPYAIDYNFIGSVHYLEQARHRVEIDGAVVEIHLGIANEQLRGYSILTKRLAWPGTGFASADERFEEIAAGGPMARRMWLQRGARSVLSYSWIEGSGSLPVEWFRKAAALDRSAFVRPAHMLAIRLSTNLGSDAAAAAAGEDRIRRAWARLAPELIGYAAITPDAT